MHTVLIDKSNGEIAFGQEGPADQEAMKADARSSGIADFEVVELSDADYKAKIDAQQVTKERATLDDVIAVLAPEQQKAIDEAVKARGPKK